MVKSLKNCVALSVSDMKEAAMYYERVLGYSRRLESPSFIEMNTGELRVFLCEDEVTAPTLKIKAEDPQTMCDYLLVHGFQQSQSDNDALEMKDPFGHVYCVVDATTEPVEDVFALIDLK